MQAVGPVLRTALFLTIGALLALPAHAQRAGDRIGKTTADTKPPVLSLPAGVRVEAASRSGATVNFTVSATDDVDRKTSVSCSPASGTVFPLGSTTVTCTSTDRAGNKATGSFSASVVDTIAPTLAMPASLSADATASTGVAVSYSVSASDRVDSAASANCTPASGSTFPLGTTAVRCGAADFSGNKSAGSFNVTVNAAAPKDTTAPVLSLPASLRAEATSASGVAVSFTAKATDNVDGNLAVSCKPASGSVLPLGSTTVQCSSTDTTGNTATGSFAVSVVDTIAPALAMPASLTADATVSSGVAVSYSVSASDRVDSAARANCTPASGSTFAPGTTAVRCDSADFSGNKSSGSFSVTVSLAAPKDTTAPALSLPASLRAEATSASGASVTFSATATDDVDRSVSVSCNPASGAAFPVGSTTVQCSSTDTAGNKATGSFAVSVADTTAPTITVPGPVSAQSASNTGTAVSYNVSATDRVDGTAAAQCTPASGSVFPPGTTPVRCSASDSSGNQSSASFDVSVSVTAATAAASTTSTSTSTTTTTTAPTVVTGSAVLSWSAPTTRADGKPISMGEIAGYEVYMLAESTGESKVIAIDDPFSTSRTIDGLTPDTYHFAISAVDTTGLVSDMSPTVSKQIR